MPRDIKAMPGDIKSYLLDGVGLWADVRLVDTGESRPLLLLDRDGVLIEDSGYVGRAAAARLYPDAVDAICAARAIGFRIAVVSNQSGIGRGRYDWAGFAAVQQVIDAALELRGVSLDAVFACAYHAEGRSPYDVAEHPWRKPRPGMILEALRPLNGLPERSALVGDQITDIEAARAGGVQTAVLIDRHLPVSAAPSLVDAVVQSLGEAIAFLSSRDAS